MNQTNKKPTLWQVICSVIAAMFGVQGSKQRTRDFSHGKPLAYILVGIVMTLLFVITIATVVKLVLSTV